MPKRRSLSTDPLEPESDDEEKVSQSQKMCFSQHAAEASQGILPPKASEQRNFDNLPDSQREKLLTDLSRLILFKGLAGEAIVSKVVCKEAGIGPDQGRIQSAVFDAASKRLRDVFGFELKRLPQWMEKQKSTKSKYSERHYLITTESDNQGDHSKALCSMHGDVAIAKGLLMVVLSLIYCKGDLRADGSRWIADADLYRLLNAIDENLPGEPPQPGSKKHSERVQPGGQGLGVTPDIDNTLEAFVKLDYIMKEKITDEQISATPGTDENTFLYALGPRAAVEIGRKQILYFCAEILDEDPGADMIQELEQDEEEEQEEMEE